MIPVITKVLPGPRSGDLVRHTGDEFLYVLSGKIVAHTEFYDPVTLGPGHCISMYIDTSMGHACPRSGGLR
jgi:uncharacterized cupin superfamily protein